MGNTVSHFFMGKGIYPNVYAFEGYAKLIHNSTTDVGSALNNHYNAVYIVYANVITVSYLNFGDTGV